MKYLLITGGAGFIGSHAICYFLSRYPDYTIVNVDKLTYASTLDNMDAFFHHPQHVFVPDDITNRQAMDSLFRQYPFSGIIHFAAESHVDNSIHGPEVFIQTNVVGTFTLLEMARKYWEGKNHRFHHISTDEVYGSLGETGHFTETTPYAPNSPYSASKAASDHLVRSYHKTYGLNTVITHCSNNYGPHQHREKFIPTVISKALAGAQIPIYGNGKNTRDWIYVLDHCEGIDRVFHHAAPGECFNMGGNHELSNILLAHQICEQLDKHYPRPDGRHYHEQIQYVQDRPGHDFRYAVSIEKIQKVLGWQPNTAFEQGLLNTIAYYAQKEETMPV